MTLNVLQFSCQTRQSPGPGFGIEYSSGTFGRLRFVAFEAEKWTSLWTCTTVGDSWKGQVVLPALCTWLNTVTHFLALFTCPRPVLRHACNPSNGILKPLLSAPVQSSEVDPLLSVC